MLRPTGCWRRAHSSFSNAGRRRSRLRNATCPWRGFPTIDSYQHTSLERIHLPTTPTQSTRRGRRQYKTLRRQVVLLYFRVVPITNYLYTNAFYLIPSKISVYFVCILIWCIKIWFSIKSMLFNCFYIFVSIFSAYNLIIKLNIAYYNLIV